MTHILNMAEQMLEAGPGQEEQAIIDDSGSSQDDDSEDDGEEDVYEVEKIVGVSKEPGGSPLYKVRWKGYAAAWDTWEPRENLLTCLEMIDEFVEKEEEKKKRRQEQRQKAKNQLVYDPDIFSPDGSTSEEDKTKAAQKASKKPTYYYVEGAEADTLKDKFWRNLDEGKVDVFQYDMYSRAKCQGRAARPQSFKDNPTTTATTPTAATTGASEKPKQKKAKSVAGKATEAKKSSGAKKKLDKKSNRKGPKKVKKEHNKSQVTVAPSACVNSSAESGLPNTSSDTSFDNSCNASDPMETASVNFVTSDSQTTTETKSESQTWSELSLEPTPPLYKVVENSQGVEPMDTSQSEDGHIASDNCSVSQSSRESDKNDQISDSSSDTGKQACTGHATEREVNNAHAPPSGVRDELNSTDKSGKKGSHSSGATEANCKKHVESAKAKVNIVERKSSELSQPNDRPPEAGGESAGARPLVITIPKALIRPSESSKTGDKRKISDSKGERRENKVKNHEKSRSDTKVLNVDGKEHSKKKELQLETHKDLKLKVPKKQCKSLDSAAEGRKDIQPDDSSSARKEGSEKGSKKKKKHRKSSKDEKPSEHRNPWQDSDLIKLGVSESTTRKVQKISDETEKILEKRRRLSSSNSSVAMDKDGAKQTPTVETDLNSNQSQTPPHSSNFPVTNYKALFSHQDVLPQDVASISPGDFGVFNDTDMRQEKCPPQADISLDTEDLLLANSGMDDNDSFFDLGDFDPDELDKQEAQLRMKFEVLDLSNGEFRQGVQVGDYELLQKALNRKRPYNMEMPDNIGMTLAMIAAQSGFDDVLELLVIHGADINAVQKNGTTPLMHACEQGHLSTVALMLEKLGANLNTQQSSGETALMKAVKRGHRLVVQILLQHGVNFATQSQLENTALKLAKTLNLIDIHDMINLHVSRLTAVYENQVRITLNNTAKIQCALFPMQCLALKENNRFHLTFKHALQPTQPGVGMLLFIAHAKITRDETKCRFYGPCAVTSTVLNGVVQPPLTEEGNFVMSFSPLHNGRNDLEINTVFAPSSRAKLVVCAYKAQLTISQD